MVVLILLAFFISIFGYVIYRKEHNGVCKSRKRLDGMTCLVTGGTSGLGLEISIDFALRGARVIVVCPCLKEGTEAIKKITEESENGNVVFKLVDLADFASVRRFAKDILETEERLDILINNAGIAAPKKGSNDYSFIMLVNYLGHFLLTVLLLPLLNKSGTPSSPSRIVNTVSILHWFGSFDHAENLADRGKSLYEKSVTYSTSKLCLIIFSRELKNKFPTPNVVINNADPGEVGTRIFVNGNVFFVNYVVHLLCRWFAKSPYEGAQTALYVALDEKVARSSGVYYRDCKPCRTSAATYDVDLARKVWDVSVKIVQLRPEELNKIRENS